MSADRTAAPRRREETLRRRLGKIGYGGDYNPEQWPAAIRAEDPALMRVANVDLVSVGIFGWAEVEPRPGEFHFDLFDRVLDDLHAVGIAVSLATMTASPPPWLSQRYPHILPVRADGTRLWPGGRQHYCPSSPVYRQHAVRLAEQVARRYAHHPALAIWHVGNEYGVHVAECHCDVSAEDFRHWLTRRYGDVASLNEAWSTTFWSQRYDDFDQVLPPRTAPTFPNPAQQLDYARFSSDAMLACYRAEVEVLRQITPDVPVTTNFCGLWKPVDFWAWAPYVDVASVDAYPDPAEPESHVESAFIYDLLRSLKGGRPWLLMEQSPSAVNWRPRNAPKPPGAMRLGSWQAVARGADAVMFFQWRQSRGGAEKYHAAMVPHAGPQHRTFREVAALGAELAAHPELAGGQVPAETALILDWPSWWALELDSHPSVDVTMREALLAHYTPLHWAGITCDVVPSTADLGGYRLVVVPNLYLVTEEAAQNLRRYVHNGGHLLLSFFSGIVDDCDRVHDGDYPGPLRELVGARVKEWWPLPEGGSLPVRLAGALGGGTTTGRLWSEVVVPDSAEVLGTFDDGELAGRPAILRHRLGRGVVWYLATRLDEPGMTAVVDAAVTAAGVQPVLPDLPAQVEAVRRVATDATSTLFLLNHSREAVRVPLPRPGRDLLTDGPESTFVDLPARGVALVREA
ncbi:beta-galactosidase [Micromonospora coxensis]|uniref:Beta-galactosidase n=1 Tax=Micromonospora coxensis TaxID=356852 RepID=A0A1C5GZ06_9ACTN|nr:beta-galactosidase [Micromonospora coxensis]SCG38990.1 beta-galactosidase [Micromonospora coxensis]